MTESSESSASLTGGCQCGAVRYRLRTPPRQVNICYCRMCQKASGGPFMAFARIKAHDLEWTRGEPSIFKSSNLAERGFCQSCGTPLTYRFVERDNISVSLGSLDHSQGMKPEMQFCHDAKASWLDELATVPVQAEFFTPELKARFINNQHPDHETR